jgi:hypothetical protein
MQALCESCFSGRMQGAIGMPSMHQILNSIQMFVRWLVTALVRLVVHRPFGHNKLGRHAYAEAYERRTVVRHSAFLIRIYGADAEWRE